MPTLTLNGQKLLDTNDLWVCDLSLSLVPSHSSLHHRSFSFFLPSVSTPLTILFNFLIPSKVYKVCSTYKKKKLLCLNQFQSSQLFFNFSLFSLSSFLTLSLPLLLSDLLVLSLCLSLPILTTK